MATDSKTSSSSATSSSTSFLDLAGSKLRNRLSSNLNESVATGASEFAKRQLEKLGWKEGEGLGKRRDGISTHIRVKKRVDEQGGLGKSTVDENLQIGNEWWKDSVGSTLAKLGSKKKNKGKKQKKKTYTDEELFEATGGSRFGTKGGKRKRMEIIGKDEEERAKESIEWDGMTAPQVILSEPSKKKKKRKIENKGEVEENKEERKKRKEEKKKRKKSDKKSKKKNKEAEKRK